MPAASRDEVAGTASWEPPLDGVMDGQPGTGMRRKMILLPGITRRAACHHCRRRSIPWTTLAHGLNSTTGESATVPGRPAPLCLFAPSVSGPTYRDPSRTTLARNLTQCPHTGQFASPYFVLARRQPSTYTHVRLGLPTRSGLVWLATWPSAGDGLTLT